MPLSPADLTQITNLFTTLLGAARVKISELPAAGSVSRSAVFPIVDAGSTQKYLLSQLLAGAVTTVLVGQDLRAADTDTLVDNSLFYDLGVITPNDGGEGFWLYDANSVAVDNIGTVIAPDSGVGRFLRQFEGPLNALWFQDGSADDTTAINGALAAVPADGGAVYLPSGDYSISARLSIPANTTAFGDGVGATTITQTTAATSVFLIDSVDFVTIRDMRIVGVSAPVILAQCTITNVQYLRLENLQIDDMGAAGVGVDFQTSTVGLVYFPVLENVVISGGAPSAWGTKIGLRLGSPSGGGILPVIGPVILGGRIWRCNIGVDLVFCDTVKAFGLAMDDIFGADGIGLRFTVAATCRFYGTRFEGAVNNFRKVVEFSATSADNVVDSVPATSTTVAPLAVTDAGIRNSWDGSDGSGGLNNRYNTGPMVYGQPLTFENGFGYAVGAGGVVTQLVDKATNVTLNEWCGLVTMDGAALAAGVAVSFNILNSKMGANDQVVAQVDGGFGAGGQAAYLVVASQNGAGAIAVHVRNITAGSRSEAITIRFTIIKGVVT